MHSVYFMVNYGFKTTNLCHKLQLGVRVHVGGVMGVDVPVGVA